MLFLFLRFSHFLRYLNVPHYEHVTQWTPYKYTYIFYGLCSVVKFFCDAANYTFSECTSFYVVDPVGGLKALHVDVFPS